MIFYLFFYIVSFLIFVFVNLIINFGLLGNSLRDNYKIYMKNNETSFIFKLFVFISVISFIIMPDSVTFFSDGEIDKTLANIKDNNVNIHNPNINLPNSLAKAVASLGVGGAVAAGLTSGSSLMKSSAPIGVKLGVTAVGGAVGGALFVSTNYMNTIAQKRAESSSVKGSSDTSFPCKSMLENPGDSDQFLDAVLGLLNVNLILHICILYLLIALAILYISNNSKLNIEFLKKVLGVNIHSLIVKLLTYTNKTNKIWMVIIWMLLILACSGSLYISYYLTLNLDIICEIYQDNKK